MVTLTSQILTRPITFPRKKIKCGDCIHYYQNKGLCTLFMGNPCFSFTHTDPPNWVFYLEAGFCRKHIELCGKNANYFKPK